MTLRQLASPPESIPASTAWCLGDLGEARGKQEQRIGQTASPRGAKSELVLAAIRLVPDPFRVAELHQACPGVSIDLIRRVLKNLRSHERVECLGRGQRAQWRKTGPIELGTTQ